MRTLIEQASVMEAVDAAHDTWPRTDDSWEATKWAIIRDPEIGEALTESGQVRTFTLDGARSLGMPSVTVVYEIQEPFIIVHDARFKDSDYRQAGHA